MEKKEFDFKGMKLSGFLAVFVYLAFVVLYVFLISYLVQYIPEDGGEMPSGIELSLVFTIFLGALVLMLGVLGFFINEPNNARVMVFFGEYKGTFKNTGFFWINPFYTKKKITLRARNLDVSPIKVNDKAGNPIMIGMVLIWKVSDTYKAIFEIDSSSFTSQVMSSDSSGSYERGIAKLMKSFEKFVSIQGDAALREVAGQYAYDNNEIHVEDECTLRSGGDTINQNLEKELNERLDMAGIEVIEARINNLAYAPEIAAVMLRRQQASAIISAREKIVEGAVGMVDLALKKISEDGIVQLDDDKKASMVSNLLVVLCADEAAQPVLNTGSLYQ
ncbi:MAG: SPFH domain-containing protein [Dysgonomonas sp.]